MRAANAGQSGWDLQEKSDTAKIPVKDLLFNNAKLPTISRFSDFQLCSSGPVFRWSVRFPTRGLFPPDGGPGKRIFREHTICDELLTARATSSVMGEYVVAKLGTTLDIQGNDIEAKTPLLIPPRAVAQIRYLGSSTSACTR